MRLDEACRKAEELNRREQARESETRYVVVSDPIGSFDANYQVIARRVRSQRGLAA